MTGKGKSERGLRHPAASPRGQRRLAGAGELWETAEPVHRAIPADAKGDGDELNSPNSDKAANVVRQIGVAVEWSRDRRPRPALPDCRFVGRINATNSGLVPYAAAGPRTAA